MGWKHYKVDYVTLVNTQCEAKQKLVCSAQLEPSTVILELLHTHSSLSHLVRIVAWLLRFKFTSKQNARTPYLQSKELQNATLTIIKTIQKDAFGDDIARLQRNKEVSKKSRIASLNPFLEDGILKLGGRLTKSQLHPDKKYPIILPDNNRFTELLILQAHMQVLHGGPKLTLAYIRERYWILSGYNAVRKQLHRCVACRRFAHQNNNQLMAELPKPRVSPSSVFAHTGVDYTGHVEIKANKGRGIKTLKGYIAVFICLATKAIHLELVSELSTPSFLAAFKRFCARRGKPSDMYSDQGTNFVGANKILQQQYKESLQCIDNNFLKDVSELGITWHFNAPAWPTAGGLWEAAVKSMKYHLHRVIGNQKFTYEEFTTLLYQIEACLNSRPLCSLNETDTDMDYLTPGHFLIGRSMLSAAQPESLHIDIRKRWQLVQKASIDFWKSWSNEYLLQLQARSKWRTSKQNFEIGDIVCVKEENLPPGKWGMGKIIETHPGSDKRVRVVTLKTAKGYMKRPITKLARLISGETEKSEPVQSTKLHTPQETLQKKRSSTRKKISLFNMLSFTFMFFIMTFTSVTSNTTNFEIVQLNPNNIIHFDAISQIEQIRDDWKLIVYYNMTTYWKSIDEIQNYVNHIKNVSQKSEYSDPHAQITYHQLEHDMNELLYYDSLLQTHHLTRQKRGLINGVGSVARALFGVLDQNFADKYEEDINKIQSNDDHLLQLIKNQTSIVEAQENVIKRNEVIMNTQFKLISEQMQNMSQIISASKLTMETTFYILTASITADRIIANLKSIQQTLINTLINMNQGHVDVHLLPPKQLKQYLQVIENNAPPDLTLPNLKDNFIDFYKILRGQVRLTPKFLLMQINVPLVTRDKYQLEKVITLPQYHDNKMMNTYPATDYIAVNMQKDIIIPLNDIDITSCLTLNDEKIFCKLDHPQYNMKMSGSICELELKSSKHKYCHTEINACSDNWIKLHKPDTWLFTCCKERLVRIICMGAMTSKRLIGNGLIKIGQGCLIRGDDFTIYAHAELSSYMTMPQHVEVPKISPLNEVINTSIHALSPYVTRFKAESHNQDFTSIDSSIGTLKEQSALVPITTHDLHHYVMIYVVLGVVLLLMIVLIYYIRKRQTVGNRDMKMCTMRPSESVCAGPNSAFNQSVLSMDVATSPMPKRTVFVKEII